jgi:hypothetical protein
MELSSMIRSRTNIPDLAAFGMPLCTPFEVRPLRRARLAWMNEGWLLRHGVDVLDPQVRHEVSSALMREYAVSSSPADVPHTAGASRTFHADRYGGSGGAAHGGSGRCGISNLFNAKGIGCTPLVPNNVDWDHAHGFMWMDEALREAVSGEIAAAELPLGAVPVIAIIDTGIEFKKEGSAPRRRAIVVRPNFLRPAHFERSIHFGDSGTADSQQYLDAMRVRQMFGALKEGSPALAVEVSLREMFLRFARQVGAMRAMRLWQGRFLSANLSVDGALVDFGSFRGVANWRCAYGLVGEIFGQEILGMRTAIESLRYYFQKHGMHAHSLPAPRLFDDEMARELDAAFIGTSLQGLGVDRAGRPRAAADLEELLWNYYRRQQRDHVQVDDDEDLRLPRIYDRSPPDTNAAALPDSDDSKESLALARYLLDARPDTGCADASLLNAQRWFRPRQDLFYNFAVREAKQCVERLPADPENAARQVAQYVDQQVSNSRRHWPALPARLEVCAQVTRGYSSALYCRDRDTGERRVWLEGCVSGERLHVFDTRIPLAGSEAQTCAGVELPADAISAHLGGVVTLEGRPIGIPPAQLHYDSRRSEP